MTSWQLLGYVVYLTPLALLATIIISKFGWDGVKFVASFCGIVIVAAIWFVLSMGLMNGDIRP